MAVALLLSGCVVPAPIEEGDPGPALLHIEEVNPSQVAEVVVQLDQDERPTFEIVSIRQTNAQQPLRYYWYYDYAPANCLPKQACQLSPCFFKSSVDKSKHVMRVVVADRELPDGAAGPFDFPEGTAWDSVEWNLDYKGGCPAAQ